MAGGMKVAVLPAVGAGPWSWGAGGCGAVRLLLVLSGCFVCGSGTAGSSCQGGGCRGFMFRKVECPQGVGRYSAEGRGRGAEKGATSLANWAPALRGQGPWGRLAGAIQNREEPEALLVET